MSILTYTLYAKLLKALANQKRIEIMRVLGNRCSTVSELIHMTGMTQANISQHLQVLRREGAVVAKRNSKEIMYCISHPQYVRLLDHIHEILADRKSIKPLMRHSHIPAAPMIVDPVCGMKVSPKHAAFAHAYKRSTYYFCASGCKKKFVKNPEKYA
ncbi:MAG: metalloregulator ArsR/SmtB family transcription factor [Patescibacteria group bacterium]